jgi:hypothetical protein
MGRGQNGQNHNESFLTVQGQEEIGSWIGGRFGYLDNMFDQMEMTRWRKHRRREILVYWFFQKGLQIIVVGCLPRSIIPPIGGGQWQWRSSFHKFANKRKNCGSATQSSNYSYQHCGNLRATWYFLDRDCWFVPFWFWDDPVGNLPHQSVGEWY